MKKRPLVKADRPAQGQSSPKELRRTIATARTPVYGSPVAAKSANGFGDPSNLAHRRPHPTAGAFFVPAASCYGGCAWETLGSAGFQVPGSPTCAQLPPSFGDEAAAPSKLGALPMRKILTLNPSTVSIRNRAAAHKAMAIAALHADMSLSVRLARYNAHMAQARSIEGGAV